MRLSSPGIPKRHLIGATTVAALVAWSTLSAQTAPRPARSGAISNDAYQKVLRMPPNPVKKRGVVSRTRGLVRMRGVSEPEWVAFHAYYGNAIHLQRLLRRGVKVDSGYMPSCGLKGNALFTAVIRDHRTIVKMLLGRGASLKFTLHTGYTSPSWGWVARTPLQIAREMKNQAMIRILTNRSSLGKNQTVRRIMNPERFLGFVAHPTSLQPVRGGLTFDYRTRTYNHATVCRGKAKYGNRLQYGVVEKDGSGRSVCSYRRYQNRRPYYMPAFEVLVHTTPLKSNQEVVWQTMYSKYSYRPAFRLKDGKLLKRTSIHSGFTLSGIDHLYYNYDPSTPAQARKARIAHEILTLMEHN